MNEFESFSLRMMQDDYSFYMRSDLGLDLETVFDYWFHGVMNDCSRKYGTN